MDSKHYFYRASLQEVQFINRLIEKTGTKDTEDLIRKSLREIDNLATDSLQGKKILICNADESHKKEHDLLKRMGER